LADENGKVASRLKHAGRATTELSLSSDQWRTFARGAERVAREVLDQTGVRTVFHHHCAGYVETPAVFQQLEQMRYRGWIVVEQDVLPGMGGPFESAKRNRQYLRGIGL
jgi:sugar phosphate isomerase/epimerase